MHVGAEASHGHYIAHIQETSTGQWFKFSDAQVERLHQGRKLGSETDPFSNGVTPTVRFSSIIFRF